MRTPKEYRDNLKNGIITNEMLGEVLYSFNKRAKNERDKSYRGYWEERRMDYYYSCKEGILGKHKPIEIHKQKVMGRERIYDYQKEFCDQGKQDEAIYWNSYWDYDEDREVEFFDIEVEKTLWFLYYKVGDYGFHQPINEHQITKKMKEELPIVELTDFVTFGEDTENLLPLNFCINVYKQYMTAA